MVQEFIATMQGIRDVIAEWEPKLSELDTDLITPKRNSQHRTIKQITGHMVDSASNNLHRIIHLQYGEIPLIFPNYATNGNNDRWIAIQNYQEEDWNVLVQLWKYNNLHIAHVIRQIDPEKIHNKWIASAENTVSLNDMVIDYLRHLKLHISEIEDLIRS